MSINRTVKILPIVYLKLAVSSRIVQITRRFHKHGSPLHAKVASKHRILVDGASATPSCNSYTDRTHNCGELRAADAQKRVSLSGWLEYKRMNKFVVIRDGHGQTQALIDQQDKASQDILERLPYESIVRIEGTVVLRPENMVNPKQATGKIEIMVESLSVLNRAADKLPFSIREFQKAKEGLRMRYRYLDLRFPEMQRNMRARSQMLAAMREFLVHECNFVDVETPTLFKATPGGAQEFVVPTRFPGEFYSLVQSPQQFKQMLMAGAIDRYFQIARCYRDETPHSDRQPEFTQLDIELSFTNINGVLTLIEHLLCHAWPDFAPDIPAPGTWTKMTYEEAMLNYGTDKPDTRFEFKIHDCTELFKDLSVSAAHYLIFPRPYDILDNRIKKRIAKILEKHQNVRVAQSQIGDPREWVKKISGLVTEPVANKLREEVYLENTSLFLAFGNRDEVLKCLGQVRLEFAGCLEEAGLLNFKDDVRLLWVVDFPLFESNGKSLTSAHHPFAAPHPDDVHLLDSYPLQVRSQAYDLVINGEEVGGGSIRIHNPDLQEKMFNMLAIEKASMQHILDMLGSGCPPHGGIALGLDRLLSIVLKTASIRDVIAFPKTFEGRDPVSGAPSPISDADKNLYHIEVIKT